jgi:hypothetical protein
LAGTRRKAMLTGKKTYIMALIMGLGAFARGVGWLDPQQFELLMGLAGSMGLAALRSGVSRTGE